LLKNRPEFAISKETERKFILGKQGLYPGRRWRGKEGVLQALRSGSVVQIDPINVVARSHDISLYGRVVDYQPALLEEALYVDRAGFDYGGTVLIYLMEELPYLRVLMRRKAAEPRRVKFAKEYGSLIEVVYQTVREHGPLSSRDFEDQSIKPGKFRSSKGSSQALYYLWLRGDLMTHSRRNFDRLYDLRERIAPPGLDTIASEKEADVYFTLKVFQQYSVITGRNWRGQLSGMLVRTVPPQEAAERLQNLLDSETIVPIEREDEPKVTRYILAEDLPVLETLQSGNNPPEWQPVDATTEDEVTFLAPLEICTARGRALPLFGFEYLWEVYKPQEKRRWGYYTLPILYGSHLVGRTDLRLDRANRILEIKGFWLEPGVSLDPSLESALSAGFQRFLSFVGAEKTEGDK
jgi:uncharacterized protein YcaQ